MLPSDIYVEVTVESNYEHPQSTKASVIMYNGTREAIVGECKLYTTQNLMNHTFEFNVLQGNYTPILSLESCVAMGFLKNLNCDQPECVYYSMKSSTVLTKQQLLEQLQDVYWCWKTGNPLQNPSSYRQLYTFQEGISVVIHSALKEKLDKMVPDGVNCTCHRSLRVAFECSGSPQTLLSPPNWHQP